LSFLKGYRTQLDALWSIAYPRRCPIAILQIIDQLEERLKQARQVPFTTQRVVDGNEFAQLLERLRITVPSSVMESERMLRERDKILSEAQAEADQLLAQARQRARELLSENSIINLAREEAERLMHNSENAARRRTEEADQYATRVLEELSAKLQLIGKQVENGLQIMRQRSQSSSVGQDSAE
jgi:cell division GTPase FtsZ